MAQAAMTPLDETIRHMQPMGAVIDRDHLARMTFGDQSLERELLQLFDRQAVILLDRMRTADGASVAALAHTLKGSAVGIGAGHVARAAAEVEQARGGAAIDRLADAVAAARACIAEHLAAA